ncbi:MAG TPA: hypothetical protein EYP30_09925 [Archaeoglobaceae archaeon]|nr:hypothetical protein [Archaeoglobaceae archaeon]
MFSNNHFDEEELYLLKEVADDIAFALNAYRAENERRKVLEQLTANLMQFERSADRLRNLLAVIMPSLELVDELGKDKVLEIVCEQARRMKKELDELRKEEVNIFRLVGENYLKNNSKSQ